MAHYNRINPEIKAQILKRVKEDGISVAQAAKEHGVSDNTVYGWLAATVNVAAPSRKEMNALRKENALLKSLIADITVELSRAQKKR